MPFSSSGSEEAFDYLFKIILIGDSNVGKTCVVWDTAGQERFRTITQSYYRSAHGAILAYDLTRRSTFESIPHWINEIEKYGATINGSLFLFKGNKSDVAENRQVLFEDACTLAEKHGLLAVLETSAKEAQNVDEVFTLMAKELIARNTLQLHGGHPLNSIYLDSRPVIVSPSGCP
uniref:RAB19, member RAS onco family n=1 Tax=Chelonoidis abingdonii TaxID=106734 RepID=A0A8C0JCM7_CHEAB